MKKWLALCSLAAVFWHAPLFAATYYVSPSGNNANPGTQTQPFQTLNKAVSVLSAGDTLEAMPGTYTESLHSVIPGGSDASHPVTLTAFVPGNRPVLRPPPGSDEAIYILGAGTTTLHDIVIDHWVIDSTYTNTRASVIILFGQRIRISNSEIKNGHNHGVAILGNTNTNQPSDGDQLLNLDIHDIVKGDYPPPSGILVEGSHTLVGGCSIHDNQGPGVLLRPDINSQLPIQSNTITGNRIYNNRTYTDSGTTFGSQGISELTGGNDVFANNVIYGNQGAGIEAGGFNTISNIQILNNTMDGNNYSTSEGEGIGLGFSTSSIIANNIVTHQSSDAIGISGADSTNLIKNNLLYSNSGGAILDYTQNAVQSDNLFNFDPLYVDLLNANFHLSGASLAINAGLPFSQVTDDLDNVTRPQGGVYDIGAYELPLPQADTIPPDVPSALTVSSVNCSSVTVSSITLSWIASNDTGGSGLAAYRIFKNGALYSQSVGSGTSFADTSPGSGPWSYNIAAVDGAGNLSAQSRLTVFTLANCGSNAPTGITTSVGDGEIVLSWNPISTATSYHVYGATTSIVSSGTATIALTTLSNSRTVNGLANGVAYYFLVTASYGGSESVASTEVSATPTASSFVTSLSADASNVRVYPSPWRSDLHSGHDLTFDNIPEDSTLKIFTVSGHWVKTITHVNGKTVWNLKNDGGQGVSSGLYLYLVTDGRGHKVRGKFSIIR